MITGDSSDTAEFIANNADIVNKNSEIIKVLHSEVVDLTP